METEGHGSPERQGDSSPLTEYKQCRIAAVGASVIRRAVTLTRAMLRKCILAVSGCMRRSVASSMARRLTSPPPAMYCSTSSARVLRGSSITCVPGSAQASGYAQRLLGACVHSDDMYLRAVV